MTATKVSLRELADLAIGTPEVGAVNFTALHTLIVAILNNLNLHEAQIDFKSQALEQVRYHGTPRPSVSAPQLSLPKERRRSMSKVLPQVLESQVKDLGVQVQDLSKQLKTMETQVQGIVTHVQHFTSQAIGINPDTREWLEEKLVTTMMPEKAMATLMPEKKVMMTTLIPEESTTTAMPGKKSTTTGMPEKLMTLGKPEKLTTSGMPEKKSMTTPMPEKLTTTMMPKEPQRGSLRIVKDDEEAEVSITQSPLQAMGLLQDTIQEVQILQEAHQKVQELPEMKAQIALEKRVEELEKQAKERDHILDQVVRKLSLIPVGDEVTMVTWEELEQAITDGWKASQATSETSTVAPKHKGQGPLTSADTSQSGVSTKHPSTDSTGGFVLSKTLSGSSGTGHPSDRTSSRDRSRIPSMIGFPMREQHSRTRDQAGMPRSHHPSVSQFRIDTDRHRSREQHSSLHPRRDEPDAHPGLVQQDSTLSRDQLGLGYPDQLSRIYLSPDQVYLGQSQYGLGPPGMDQPRLVYPSIYPHGVVPPSTGQQGVAPAGMDQQGFIPPLVPGRDQQGLPPSTDQRGMVPPGIDHHGVEQIGMDAHGFVPLGMDQYESVIPFIDQSGLVPPGLTQAGTDQRAFVQPHLEAPGFIQPGTEQHDLVQPGSDQRSLVQPGTDQRSLIQPGADQHGLVQPGADQRGLVQPGAEQRGLVQPGADQRGLMQPGAVQCGMVQPGAVQHGMVQPGAEQRGLVQPGADQRGLMQPGAVQRGMVQPGAVQRGLVQPGADQRGMVQPGAVQRGLVQPGANQRGLMQPGAVQRSMVQPGAVQRGMVQPGADQRGFVQPGAVQRGLIQPGADQRGLVQPGAVQHGLTQPGADQHGLVQPGADQHGLVQPGADKSGLLQPGTDQRGSVQPGLVQPGADQHGLVQPGAYPHGWLQPGTYPPGLVHPGAYLPGLVQPGAYPHGLVPLDVDQPGLVQPGAMQHGLVQGDAEQHGLVQPGAYPPSLGQPGADQHGLLQPGADQRGLVQPGVDQHGLVQPGAYPPSLGQPGADQHGLLQPGADQRGLVQPGVDQHGVVQPGAYPPSLGQPGADHHGLVRPGAYPPTLRQPGAYLPILGQPGAYPPSFAQHGAYLPNLVPPGTDQHGLVQPGADQRGLAQPGVGQLGLVQPGMYQHGLAQPGADQHGLVQPAEEQRGSGQPGADQPGSVQPGADQPGSVQPGADQPGSVQPGADQPGSVQPGGDQPGSVQPGGDQPGSVQPGGDQPGSVQPGGEQPGLVQPGAEQRGFVQPGVYPHDLVQPGAYPFSPVQASAYPPGSVQPGAYLPGSVQPGAYLPGLVQPGAYPRGLVQPSAYPPGLVQAGAYPRGLVQPGTYPHGLLEPGAFHRGLAPHGLYQQGLLPPGTELSDFPPLQVDSPLLVSSRPYQQGIVLPGRDQYGQVSPLVAHPGLTPPVIDQEGLVLHPDQQHLVLPGPDQSGHEYPGPMYPDYPGPGYLRVDQHGQMGLLPNRIGASYQPGIPDQTGPGQDTTSVGRTESSGVLYKSSSENVEDSSERRDSLDKLAPSFPMAVETLRLMGELIGLYVALKEHINDLEEEQTGQTDLEKIQYLIAQMVKKSIPPDLQEQMKGLKSVAKEVRQEKAKLDRLQRILEGEGMQEPGKEVKAGQLSLQLGVLRVTVADIEKELAELRESQERGKVSMEHSVSEASLYLQDQLDKLRTIIESMLTSSSTLLSMSMTPSKARMTLAPGQIDPEATCPACSLDVSHQVSTLVQRYEQLQDMVSNLAASRPSKKAKLQSQDEELLGHVQSAILQVQGDCEKLNITTSNLIEDHRQKQKDIDVLYQGIEKLEKEKANREHLEMEIDVKADKSALAGKVSRIQFDATTEQLNHMMRELVAKMSGQEQDWQKMLDKLLLEMDNKLDRLELDPVKQMLEDRWKSLRQQLKERSPLYQADEAAAMRRQLLAHFHCLSCDRPLETPVTGQIIPVTPVGPGLPWHRSIRPYTIFELEQVRQQSRNLKLGGTFPRGDLGQMERSVGRLRTMHSKMLMDIEKVQIHFGGSVKASSQMIRELLQAQCLSSPCYKRVPDMADYSYAPVPRRCGGSHTLTYPYRRSRLQHLPQGAYPTEEIQIAMKHDEVDILGLDGHIYKGRMDTRLPGILTKDAPGVIKHKSQQSRLHIQRQQPMGNSGQLPLRPQSAQMLAGNNSAPSRQRKDRPVSSEGRLSQSNVVHPPSPDLANLRSGSPVGLEMHTDMPPQEGLEEPTRGPRSTAAH